MESDLGPILFPVSANSAEETGKREREEDMNQRKKEIRVHITSVCCLILWDFPPWLNDSNKDGDQPVTPTPPVLWHLACSLKQVVFNLLSALPPGVASPLRHILAPTFIVLYSV